MDSLTQIVLGAACGEVVLGKKVGNRAMLWGAIGGTIPDLDILGNFMMTEIEALAFHRGISHSIFFAVTAPFLFGWLVHRLYQSGLYQNRAYKSLVFLLSILFTLGASGIFNLLFRVIGGDWNYVAMIISILIGGWAIKHLYTSYLNKELPFINASQKDWTRLFFWSIFTHPLLDAFTAYGTQLFAPFSDYRVAFNTISVADPIYTIPFLLCLIAASFYRRDQVMRRYLNFMGIILSSAYLLFTVFNKKRIDRVFEQSFQAENIDYKRFRTGPSIFNNILWNGVAETEDAYYYGMYSLLDKEPKVYQFFKTPKNHHLIAAYEDDPDIKILQWFTDGYYTVDQMPDNKLQIGDMRYGTIKERQARPEDYVFKFSIVPNDEGGVDAFEARDMDQREDAFGDLWTRIKGR